VVLSELREEAGYELAKDGHLIGLGHYFSSPGFTDEHGYFFLARPVEPCADYVRDETESIVDCREFGIEELRRMITKKEIRDANTLSIWARLVAGGFLSPGRPCMIVDLKWRCETFLNSAKCQRAKVPSR